MVRGVRSRQHGQHIAPTRSIAALQGTIVVIELEVRGDQTVLVRSAELGELGVNPAPGGADAAGGTDRVRIGMPGVEREQLLKMRLQRIRGNPSPEIEP